MQRIIMPSQNKLIIIYLLLLVRLFELISSMLIKPRGKRIIIHFV
uniref:Uncharacterized protein n=1 Tax=Anguilla anguilla TaxID=7936 RepID=A0A0E9UW16_ANGAN